MQRFAACLLFVIALGAAAGSRAAQTFAEGEHYVRLAPEQRTSVPAGKVEVMEVFSYACPSCNAFQPTMAILRKSLPANAQLVYLPAAFHPNEDWPVFQRAFFAAQALGLAERTHQAIFDAVWKSGELAIADQATHQLKNPMPSIQDVARYYAHLTGVKPEEFLAAANSFSVDVRMRGADAQILAMQVPGTPCIIVNGKWRVIMESVPTPDQLVALVRFLVGQESAAR